MAINNTRFFHISSVSNLEAITPQVCSFETAQAEGAAVYMSTSPYPHWTISHGALPWRGTLYEVRPTSFVYGRKYREVWSTEPVEVIANLGLCEHTGWQTDIKASPEEWRAFKEVGGFDSYTYDSVWGETLDEILVDVANPYYRLTLVFARSSEVLPDLTPKISQYVYRL